MWFIHVLATIVIMGSDISHSELKHEAQKALSKYLLDEIGFWFVRIILILITERKLKSTETKSGMYWKFIITK